MFQLNEKPRLALRLGLGATLLLWLMACGGPVEPLTPAAPSNVSVEPGPGYISVSWQDNSDDETGFEVYRDFVSDLQT